MNSQNPILSRRTAIKSIGAGAGVCILADTLDTVAMAASRADQLPRSSPEAVGIDPAGIAAFVEGVNQKVGGLHSFMLLRHGQVAAEGWWAPYAPGYRHMLYSLSKSFTSTAIGLAIADGLLTVEAPVTSFFIADGPSMVSDNLRDMRVKHLLTMNTGHDKDATGSTTTQAEGNWVKGFLALPVEHKPGSKFVYNSAATYMLSAIVQKLTGKTVLEFLKSRLFDPLGIHGQTWETCPKGINTGGWGLAVKTEDIAKFGQLYLQKGKWNGHQLVPESWVADATSKQVSNGNPDNPSDWTQGYGYQFWRCRHNGFRGDGAFGQYCVVMPEHDAVLAITSGIGDMQAVLNVAWEHLLPAFGGKSKDVSDAAKLKLTLKSLSVNPPKGEKRSPESSNFVDKSYIFASNNRLIEEAKIAISGSSGDLVLRVGGVDRKIEFGNDAWVRSTASAGVIPPGLVPRAPITGLASAMAAWSDPKTLVIKRCFCETPYEEAITCKFEENRLKLSFKMNVGFGPTDSGPIVGVKANLDSGSILKS